MTYRHFKREGWLYALAFLLAIALRFIQLGALPLADAEAAPALQALRIAQGLKPALAPHPFYILSTSVLFFIYGGGTNFLARFFPALMGSLLVFAPRLFAERIKPRSSLFIAFFIALDPGLVALSRQAASPIFAIAFLLFAWGFFNQNKLRGASFFAALALLSGASIWAGVLGLGIAYAIYQALSFRHTSESVERRTFNLQESLVPFLVTLIVVGTLFFAVPNGLSAALASIPEFISRWTYVSDVPASRALFSLLIYQPLGVLLALSAVIRGWWKGSRRVISLSVWFFVALALAVFIPSRQISDLAWALIPLWALAALELTRNVDFFVDERVEVIGVVLLTAFVWIFAWLDFAGMVWNPTDSAQYAMRFWLLIGAACLLIFSLALVAAGWSFHSARIGGVWGLALTCGALGFAGTLGAAGLRGTTYYPELWRPANVPAQVNLLQATVSELSKWSAGDANSAPVVIAGVHSPALEWALRDHQVAVVESLDISSAPDFVITPLQNNPALASAYRGQDFTWRQNPSWNVALPKDWMRWVALREMPQSGETVILWARDDLFLDK